MKRTVSCKESKNEWRVIKIGGADWIKDKLEWILAFILIAIPTMIFLVGTIYTMRGIHSLFTM